MKKLFTLLIIWLSLTIYLAYDNVKLSEFKEFNVHWRAFLVYSSSLSGCMTGAGIANSDYEFFRTYSQCLKYAYNEKDLYEGKWKK